MRIFRYLSENETLLSPRRSPKGDEGEFRIGPIGTSRGDEGLVCQSMVGWNRDTSGGNERGD